MTRKNFGAKMRAKPLNTCLVCLCCFIYSSALPRSKDYRDMSSEYVPGGDTSIQSDPLSKEPTCEELRAMWRFSKRQSRAAEITNEIPTFRDPFAFNVWEEYARPRSAGRGVRYRKPLIYGKVVHHPQYIPHPPDRLKAFEEVARLFGSPINPEVSRRKTSFRLGGGGGLQSHVPIQTTQSGSFQHLKELIRNERLRELQEQRINEDADRNVGKIHYGRITESSPRVVENALIQDKATGLVPSKGIVAFPNMLGPASYSYIDEYPMQQLEIPKVKQRYPDTSVWRTGIDYPTTKNKYRLPRANTSPAWE